ncbi:hypothetical protein C8Q77DRAFT_1162443 [Trametes polyzona]|nr:hypothetical protein C8Q77DRAFT_1162443 [Trametes polyzona]
MSSCSATQHPHGDGDQLESRLAAFNVTAATTSMTLWPEHRKLRIQKVFTDRRGAAGGHIPRHQRESRLASQFADEVERLIGGSNELEEANGRSYDAFATAIRNSAPSFVPWETVPAGIACSEHRGSSTSCVTAGLDKCFITLTGVRARIQTSITRELPGSVPYAAKLSFIRQYQGNWAAQVETCLQEIAGKLRRALMELAHQYLGGYENLERDVRFILLDLVHERVEFTASQLKYLLTYEGKRPATMSRNLLDQYREMYLEWYTHAHENPSWIKTVTAPESTPRVALLPLNPFASDLSDFPLALAASISYDDLTTTPSLYPDGPGCSATATSGCHTFEDELLLMAEIRAYFDISSQRFMDYVPCVIREHLLYSFSSALRSALRQKLGFTGSGTSECEKYSCEDHDVAIVHEEGTLQEMRT